jgi:glycosyltransferase involved in cell wall biosynthesis
MSAFQNKHILIIVENLAVPFDRRVWQEANTLRDNGAKVSIICPKMKGSMVPYEVIDDIEIYRHPNPFEANSAIGYFVEYLNALIWELFLSWKIYFKKRFHVIHGCNPPDLIFLVALWFKIFGVKFVFDHHDINPELFIAKFGRKGLLYRVILILERLTFSTADYCIATNESYKEIAIRRGKVSEDKIQVVRSGPKLARLKLLPPDKQYFKGRKYLVGYVGVIGEQEGIDLLIESAKHIVSIRKDIQFAIIGEGTSLGKMKQLSTEMGLDEYIDFYGRLSDELLVAILNSADVCINPDKPNEMNNLSTMNKIMEYMALKKPIVQYDLKEGRFTAREASLYAKWGDTIDFAEKIMQLVDNPELREEMGDFAYKRVLNELSWKYESVKLVRFYKMVFSKDLIKHINKIFVAGTRGIPNIQGGVETHCEELYPRIVSLGYEVHLVRRSCYIPVDDKLTEFRGVKLYNLYTIRERAIETLLHTFLAVFLARIKRAKILHIHAIGPAIFTPLARLLGMKVVFTHHGPDYDRSKWGPLARFTLKLGERLGISFANEVIVISEVIQKKICQKYKRTNTNLIFNGVNPPVFSSKTNYIENLGLKPRSFVLALGRFVSEKGFDLLIQSFSELKLNDFKLVIAGSADHETPYSRNLEKLAVANNVVLTGFVKGEELHQLFTHARLFVLPSFHEGLPISLLEAMSYSLPVLVSDIQANKQILLPEDRYFVTGDKKSLEDCLAIHLLQKFEQVNYNMSNYNWDQIALQTADVYNKILKLNN